MTRSAKLALCRTAVVIVPLLLIEALCRTAVINPLTLLAPSDMALHLWDLLRSGDIDSDIAQSSWTVAAAFILSILTGVLLGAVVHGAPRLRRALDPLLSSYYSVPSFVFYPLLVSIFGLNSFPLVVLCIAFATPAMMMSVIAGLDRVPPVLRRTARMHRMTRLQTLGLITLPSAAPSLFAGMKLALAYSFIGIIAGEFILAGAGLGHSIAYAYESFDNATMYALMLFVVVIVTAMNMGLHVWEQRLNRRRVRQ
jgi:NitT/TauT family transport system permease protein